MQTSKDFENVMFLAVKENISIFDAINRKFPNIYNDIDIKSIKNIDASFTDGIQFTYKNDRGVFKVSIDVIVRQL